LARKRWYWFLSWLALVALLVGPASWAQEPWPAGARSADGSAKALLAELTRQAGGALDIAYHAGTGKVRFLGSKDSRPLVAMCKDTESISAEMAARAFLGRYGILFGLQQPAHELQTMRVRTVDDGRSFVRFQQVYADIPILGGEIVVQVDNQGCVVSAQGELLPMAGMRTAPAVTAAAAQESALEAVARDYALERTALQASEPALWIYHPVLLGAAGPQRSALVWRTEATAGEGAFIRELALVDAMLGTVTLHFNQVDAARRRVVYDNENHSPYGLPGHGPARGEGEAATGIADVDQAYDYAGDVYNFYAAYHGRDSLDDAGMPLVATVRYCPAGGDCPYQNAFWTGAQMVYGQGYAAADDVVAHEMTHGVTQHESDLFYYMQSGAISEAFSDIWGEFVDLTNRKGNDSASVRWLLGEDSPQGAFRSLSNPPAYGNPDRMTSSLYACGAVDNGGVHSNSGVANKAAYLMADGGAFHGQSVAGLGIAKTAKIWYETQTNLLTSAGDYQDLYSALQLACRNLIGEAGITGQDCVQASRAVEATEMDRQPAFCAASEAPICPEGSVPQALFHDDLEDPFSGRWGSAAMQGANAWYYPQTINPAGVDATYATSGRYNFWGYDQPEIADYAMQMKVDVSLPADGQTYLRFNHAFSFDTWHGLYYD